VTSSPPLPSGLGASPHPEGEPTDRELLAAHLAGDRYAFARLAERHLGTLWSVALRALADRRDADEAVQDTLVRAHQGAAGYRGEASVRHWLVRILVNVCRDRYRRNRRRAEHGADPHTLAAAPDPRDLAGEVHLRLEVWEALLRLPLDQRLVVLLVNGLGYGVEEVAERFGIPVGTLKSRGNRGRRRLRALLENPEDPS
jgi:RNA polymerase sigma-70 factor, ECF subfamily